MRADHAGHVAFLARGAVVGRTPMSAAPALTPLRTTPQNPSWAWPWVTISILISLRLTSAPSGRSGAGSPELVAVLPQRDDDRRCPPARRGISNFHARFLLHGTIGSTMLDRANTGCAVFPSPTRCSPFDRSPVGRTPVRWTRGHLLSADRPRSHRSLGSPRDGSVGGRGEIGSPTASAMRRAWPRRCGHGLGSSPRRREETQRARPNRRPRISLGSWARPGRPVEERPVRRSASASSGRAPH